MQDNALIQLFLPLLNTGLTTLGYTEVDVVQSHQPLQTGASTPPIVYFYKISDWRYGFLKRIDVWNSLTSKMIHTETQQYETTFRIHALVLQNPLNPSFTASDLVNSCAAILQSDTTIDTLETQGVGILKIGAVQNPYFTDDRDNFEASPSFDFILTHKQIITVNDPIISAENVNIYRV